MKKLSEELKRTLLDEPEFKKFITYKFSSYHGPSMATHDDYFLIYLGYKMFRPETSRELGLAYVTTSALLGIPKRIDEDNHWSSYLTAARKAYGLER